MRKNRRSEVPVSLMTISEVSEILNVSKAHVYNLIAKRALPSVKIGFSKRIRPQDLNWFIQENLDSSLRKMAVK